MNLTDMEAGLYLRKSRADEDGQSVEDVLSRHQAILTEYAKNHHIHIIETYPEVASGDSLYARPQMLRLLEDVEAGQYDCVLCMDLDRLSRGRMRDQGIVLDAFKDSGTLIVTPEKVYDLSVETDEQYAELKTFISRQEYKAITKRLHRGRLRSVREGCYVQAAPYGYRNVTIDRKPTLEVFEPEAKYVRLMFDWYASGIGCLTISYRLKEMGARSATGIDIGERVIKRILKNPVYIGKVSWGQTKVVRRRDCKTRIAYAWDQWQVYDGIHPAIVEKEVWDKVQEIIKERYAPVKRDGTLKSSLAGIVRCEKCGGRMQRLPYKKLPPYLSCFRKGCSAMTRLDLVERAVLDCLADSLDELNMDAALGGKRSANLEIQRKRLGAIQNEMTAAEKKKARLYDFLEDGTYSKTEFRERMDAVKRLIENLERQEQEARSAIETAENRDPGKLARMLQTVLDGYWEADVAERNALLKSVIEVAWYQKDHKTKPTDFMLRVILKSV